MNDMWGYTLALMAGIMLGIFFFGGLWWTARRIPFARRPSLLVLLSFFARSVVVMAGFWLIGFGQWQRFIVCLGGFVLARFIVNLWIKTAEKKEPGKVVEDVYEIKP